MIRKPQKIFYHNIGCPKYSISLLIGSRLLFETRIWFHKFLFLFLVSKIFQKKMFCVLITDLLNSRVLNY